MKERVNGSAPSTQRIVVVKESVCFFKCKIRTQANASNSQ